MAASSRGDSGQAQVAMANNAEAGPSRPRLSGLLSANSSQRPSSTRAAAAAATETAATATAAADVDPEPLRNPTPASFFPTPALDHAFAGITAGAIATVCMNPLDLIKTQFQVDTGTSSKGKGKDLGSGLGSAGSGVRREGFLAAMRRGKVVTDIYGALREILKRDGFPGLYRGLSPNVVGNSASWGLYFLWYTMIKEHMSLSASADGTDRNRKLSATQHLLAASESGAVTALMTNPIWVVKTRMFTAPVPSKVPVPGEPPNPYRSLRSSLAHIYQTEGVRGLWKGAGLALFGVSNGAIQFMAYEQLKRYRSDAILLKRGGDVQPEELGSEGQVKLSNTEYVIISGAAKLLAILATYPYQVVRSRVQNHSTLQQYPTVRSCVAQTWKGEGTRGFYKGLGTNLIRIIPATCVTFVVYENVSWALGTAASRKRKLLQQEGQEGEEVQVGS